MHSESLPSMSLDQVGQPLDGISLRETGNVTFRVKPKSHDTTFELFHNTRYFLTASKQCGKVGIDMKTIYRAGSACP